MPTYDYYCQSCSQKVEIFQKISADPIKTCSHCQQDTLKRGPGGGIGLSFIGSGFYINDYGPKKTQEAKDTPSVSPGGACCPCGKNQTTCNNS